MKKIGKFIGCFGPVVLAILCQIVISFGLSIGYGIYIGIKATSLGITDMAEREAYATEAMGGDTIMVITAIATAVTLLIAVLWYRGYRPKKDFSFKEVVNPKLLGAMACLGLSMQLLISMCLRMVYPILPQNMIEQYGLLMESLLGGNIWLSLLIAVVLAPLTEEFLFRGVTLKMAQGIMPFMAANTLQAVLFGIYHMNWIQGVYAFVLGLILGYTVEYFQSIWAGVLLHAFVNGSAELIGIIPEGVSETTVGVAGIAVAGVVLLFVAAKLYPGARTIREDEVLQEQPEDLFE